MTIGSDFQSFSEPLQRAVSESDAFMADPDEVYVEKYPGWLRLLIVLGGSLALWAAIIAGILSLFEG
jgi:hypothetical protein